ncbi:MAG TPA: hypothetical protein VF005_05975 [Acidimicrobiales bacterium]
MNTLAEPPAWKVIEAALAARAPVALCYHGRRRVVCPHALGWKNARPMLLGYQIAGETSTGALDPDPNKRWRLMFIDEIDRIEPAGDTVPWASGANYNAAHPFPAIDEVVLAI